jgi:hypothetical protein
VRYDCTVCSKPALPNGQAQAVDDHHINLFSAVLLLLLLLTILTAECDVAVIDDVDVAGQCWMESSS